MSEYAQRKLGLKEDWPAVPYLLIASSGFVVSIYDFVILQNLRFHLNIAVIVSLLLLIIGGILRIASRKALTKAGFSLVNSSRLRIVDDQHLVTDGVCRRIRHPLYLGEITRNLGFALLLSSLYGVMVMVVGNMFLALRIEIEEKMLVKAFGQKYVGYQLKTKKLIPGIY